MNITLFHSSVAKTVFLPIRIDYDIPPVYKPQRINGKIEKIFFLNKGSCQKWFRKAASPIYLKSIFLFPLNQLEIIKITFWNYSLKFISPFSVHKLNNYPAKEYQNAVEQRKGDKSKLSILPRNNKCYPPRESASNWKEFKWIFLQYFL